MYVCIHIYICISPSPPLLFTARTRKGPGGGCFSSSLSLFGSLGLRGVQVGLTRTSEHLTPG